MTATSAGATWCHARTGGTIGSSSPAFYAGRTVCGGSGKRRFRVGHGLRDGLRTRGRKIQDWRGLWHRMVEDVISDAAVQRATGHVWAYWSELMDGMPRDIDHTERVKRLAQAAPELSGWWQQSLAVRYERERGLRVLGQTHTGDFQVGCSKTLSGTADEVWQRLLATPPLAGGDWRPGAAWDVGAERIEARRVDPPSRLRWFWHDVDGKSTVEVDLEDKGDRTTVRVRHHGLPDGEAREEQRARWRTMLERLARTTTV